MPYPFPGMDPYLEDPAIWPQVHTRLIVALADELTPKLQPRYWVSIEERTYLTIDVPDLVGVPDVAVTRDRAGQAASPAPAGPARALTVEPGAIAVQLPRQIEVKERYLEIQALPGGEVITVVEFLSPTNKRPGRSREQYQQKRMDVLETRTHLVEVDLIRGWPPFDMVDQSGKGLGQYRILISRSERRPLADLFPFSIRQPIPAFHLPLRAGDEEPIIDLGALLHDLYDRARYDLRIDYKADPNPPLPEEDAAWVEARLREQGIRE